MDYHIDAKNKILGRLAAEISGILQGKKNATYAPNRVAKDKVYVTNYTKFRVTGRKREQKVYYKHTGYIGHLREKSMDQLLERDPKRVLREAVRKMLPRNFLTAPRLKNLVFVDDKK